MAYVHGYLTHTHAISCQWPYILPLTLTEKREVHFRNNGKTSVCIHNPYKRFDIPSLIDTLTRFPGFAETESTFPKALGLLHHPHTLMTELFGSE